MSYGTKNSRRRDDRKEASQLILTKLWVPLKQCTRNCICSITALWYPSCRWRSSEKSRQRTLASLRNLQRSCFDLKMHCLCSPFRLPFHTSFHTAFHTTFSTTFHTTFRLWGQALTVSSPNPSLFCMIMFTWNAERSLGYTYRYTLICDRTSFFIWQGFSFEWYTYGYLPKRFLWRYR